MKSHPSSRLITLRSLIMVTDGGGARTHTTKANLRESHTHEHKTWHEKSKQTEVARCVCSVLASVSAGLFPVRSLRCLMRRSESTRSESACSLYVTHRRSCGHPARACISLTCLRGGSRRGGASVADGLWMDFVLFFFPDRRPTICL